MGRKRHGMCTATTAKNTHPDNDERRSQTVLQSARHPHRTV